MLAQWKAQNGTRRVEALDTEPRAHGQTRTEVREARAIGEERNRRIEDQGNELRQLLERLQPGQTAAGQR